MTTGFVFLYLSHESRLQTDQQLETLATSIVASGINRELLTDFDRVDDLLMDRLGGTRVDRMIQIYEIQNSGPSPFRLVYANGPAQLIALPQPTGTTSAHSVNVGPHLLRVLETLAGHYLIQVAVTMDPVLSRSRIWERRFTGLLLFMTLLTTGLTLVAVQIVLRPMRQTTASLEHVTRTLHPDPGHLREATEALRGLSRRWINGSNRRDEIGRLQGSLSQFAEVVAILFESWDRQFAILMHEIKTPLAYIRNDLASEAPMKKISQEVDRLAALARDFIQWSQLNSVRKEDRVYAVRVDEVVKRVVRDGLGEIEETRLFAEPEHVEQLVRNLVENARRHGRDPIQVKLQNETLTVTDQGPGIPETVLTQIGAPFNRGPESDGSGLGLAWITAVCKRYGWRWSVSRDNDGFRFEVQFRLPSAASESLGSPLASSEL